jgi:phage shock protein PspC (stress-responsive transcriptional regulator)
MKKTINISIGGFSFQIEEDAYVSLEKYLNAVKEHFSEYAEAEEIVSDIESRIADQFSEKTGSEKIVTKEIVEELIAAMGTPEQFGGEQKEKKGRYKKISEEFGARKFYRDPANTVIAGVASGIAAYFGNIDPVWVRLAFALSIFFGGFGILLYLLLWIIVPLAETNTEKMEMRGEPINIKNLEKTVKDRLNEFKHTDRSWIGKVLNSFFSVIGRTLRFIRKITVMILRVCARIIGFLLILAAAFALAGTVFIAVSILCNSNSPYIGFPIEQIAMGSDLIVTVTSAFFIVFFPLMCMMLLGESLLSLKVRLGIRSMLIIFTLWLISIAVFASFVIKLAPRVEALVESGSDHKYE